MENKTFLLIEDTPTDRFYAHYLLKEAYPDCEILDAADGLEALEILESENGPKIDIIFLDINMPGMNGFEFLEVYSQKELGIKVCMLSSSNNQDDIDKAFAFECVKKYFTKPLDLTDLQEIFAHRRPRGGSQEENVMGQH